MSIIHAKASRRIAKARQMLGKWPSLQSRPSAVLDCSGTRLSRHQRQLRVQLIDDGSFNFHFEYARQKAKLRIKLELLWGDMERATHTRAPELQRVTGLAPLVAAFHPKLGLEFLRPSECNFSGLRQTLRMQSDDVNGGQ